MSYEQISGLLERYWEGETTLEEERLLKQYFTAGPVDVRLQEVGPLFQAFTEEQTIGFSKANISHLQPRRVRWQRWAAAAALLLAVALGGWMGVRQMHETQLAMENKDTYEDPQKAVAEIKAALALVSRKLNKGKHEAAKGLNKVDTVEKYFKKPKSHVDNNKPQIK